MDERTAGGHDPVLRDRCVELLAPALTERDSVYVDCTLGMGGHASAVLTACPGAFCIGIDRDAQALQIARARLEADGHAGRFHLVHATYDRVPAALEDAGREAANAILMDLGLSSYQIDTVERGFSYSVDAPLDMRMDPDSGAETAAGLVARADTTELTRIISRFGEDRFAARIARAIVRARDAEPITRTGQLAAVIDAAVPAAAKRGGGHPAKRTFQALRIAVNTELDLLPTALTAALDTLEMPGRAVVESYHSLEDRLVKREFVRRATSSAPPGLPVELEEHKPHFRLLTRGAERAGEIEMQHNPRSAPVRLRAIERIRHVRKAT